MLPVIWLEKVEQVAAVQKRASVRRSVPRDLIRGIRVCLTVGLGGGLVCSIAVFAAVGNGGIVGFGKRQSTDEDQHENTRQMFDIFAGLEHVPLNTYTCLHAILQSTSRYPRAS